MKLFNVLVIVCFMSAAGVSYGLDPNNFDPYQADFYFPFEGEDTGFDAEPWQNKGVTANGAIPTEWMEDRVGDDPSIPKITVTDVGVGVIGRAADSSHFVPNALARTHYWGSKGSTVRPMEEALLGSKSITVAFWYYRTTDSDEAGMPFYSSNLTVQDRTHWAKFAIGSWHNSPSNAFDARNRWLFCAVTVDTTKTTGNVKVYSGTLDEPVQLQAAYDEDNANYDTDWFMGIGYGGPDASYKDPFVGYVDEVRVFFSDDDTAALDFNNITKIYEASVLDSCQKVRDAGYTLAADFNGDCYITIDDIALMAADWLLCNDPEEVDCIQNW